MSHFNVLVIGPDHENQLAPYHEFECTGINDEYVDQDITSDVLDQIKEESGKDNPLSEGLDYFGLKAVESEADVDTDGPHKYGFAIVKDGELQKAVKRTNPNKKWDWYVVGGRWTGWLRLKPGAAGELGRPGIMTHPAKEGTADCALKGSVDFEAMRDEEGREAGETWDAVRRITDQSWESWDQVRGRISNIEQAREFYWGQPGIKALRESGDQRFSFMLDDTLSGTREDYVQAARDRACVPYAVVKDGEWIGKGEMGWWGITSGDSDQAEWNARINDILDGISDDTQLTLVDCHI